MKLGLTTLAVIAASANVVAATCYTVPEEYRSGLWEATVDGQANGVASARTCDPPFDKRYDFGGEYAFTSFEMDAPAKVTVRPKAARDMSKVRILPASAPVMLRTLPDGALELSVARPCRFSVEPDGRRHPLLVFANPPERNVPDEKDPKVKVFGPGVHLGGENGRIELKDGETLYLKAGAFVKGGIYAHGKGIRICGRGVLDSSPWEWRKGPTGHVVQMWECQDVTVEDITIRGASHWTVVPTKCDGVTVRNVKLCGGRVQNDDGINPCNSRNVLIEDCFIRTDDDCIAAKGLKTDYGNCENVTVRNCVFWCDRARIMLLGHESRAPYMRNFLYENCDVVHFQMPVFLMEPGEEMRMENIRVKDFRINTDVPGRTCAIVSARPTVNMYMRTKVPGHIADCSFENMSVTGARADCKFLLDGRDETHKLKNVVISGASLYGTPVKAGDPACRIGAFTENVVVREAAAVAPAIKVRNGVPNAALFARRNVTGNQYFFCLGDSRSTPWFEFARIVAKDLNVRTIPHAYPEPAGAGFARYSCVNGQAIYGERVCSGYLAVLDFSATGARGDVKREAAYLENLVRAIYGYRATHSVIILHTTPSPYVAEVEKVADHYGIPTLDLTDAKDAAERSARLTAFAATLFKDAAVPAKPVPRKLPPPLHPGAELRPQIVSYEHPEVRFDDGWLGWQRPTVQQLRHVIDAKRKGAKVTLTFTGSEVGVFDEATPQSSAFVATIDGGAPRVVAPPAGGKVFLRHTLLFEGLDPAREHVLTLEVRDDAPLRLAGFSLSGSVKTPKETRTPLERMRQKLEALPPMAYEPPSGRFAYIPKTMRRLREGGDLTIVMLGDSIVNDTSASRFEELLMKRYPKCRIRKVVSVRGSTGCDWYAQENRVREWALKYKPDLMMIGGISHRPDPAKMRDVVRQIRAEKPDTEFLLLTPVFGSEANVWNRTWTPQIDHTTPNPRAIIERIAAEEKCAFFDMTGPLGVFIRDSKMARGAFMRDVVHANERGFAVLGELLNRWFAPEN